MALTPMNARGIATIILGIVVFWQVVLEPRLEYFRNRDDHFSQDLLKAKFLFVAGSVLMMIGEIILWYRVSLFMGFVLVAFGIWRLHLAITNEQARAKDQNQESD